MPPKPSGPANSGKAKQSKSPGRKPAMAPVKSAIKRRQHAQVADNKLELHFQRGFTGQQVIVSVDGAVQGTYILRTRMQISRAAKEYLTAHAGQTLSVEIPELLAKEEYTITRGDHYLTINLIDQKIRITPVQRRPGYV